MEAALDADVNYEIPPTVPISGMVIAPKGKGKGRARKRKSGPATGKHIFLKLPTYIGVVLTDLVCSKGILS